MSSSGTSPGHTASHRAALERSGERREQLREHAERRSQSILFRHATGIDDAAVEPEFFADLNLDRVRASIIEGRDEHELEPFFQLPLHDVDAVAYRHEVFRDLEVDPTRSAIVAFGAKMRRARSYLTLAGKQHHRHEKERWFLDAATVYCDAVEALTRELGALELGSRGPRSLRDYLAGYTRSDSFTTLAATAHDVTEGLARIRYTVRIRSGRVTVAAYEGEPDYRIDVEETRDLRRRARLARRADREHGQPGRTREPGAADVQDRPPARRRARLRLGDRTEVRAHLSTR